MTAQTDSSEVSKSIGKRLHRLMPRPPPDNGIRARGTLAKGIDRSPWSPREKAGSGHQQQEAATGDEALAGNPAGARTAVARISLEPSPPSGRDRAAGPGTLRAGRGSTAGPWRRLKSSTALGRSVSGRSRAERLWRRKRWVSG